MQVGLEINAYCISLCTIYVAIKRSLVAIFISFALLLIPYMALGNACTLFDVQDWKTTHYDGRQRWADVTSHWATVVYGGRKGAVCGGD